MERKWNPKEIQSKMQNYCHHAAVYHSCHKATVYHSCHKATVYKYAQRRHEQRQRRQRGGLHWFVTDRGCVVLLALLCVGTYWYTGLARDIEC